MNSMPQTRQWRDAQAAHLALSTVATVFVAAITAFGSARADDGATALPKPTNAYFFVSQAHGTCLLALRADERIDGPTLAIAGTDRLMLALDRLCDDGSQTTPNVVAKFEDVKGEDVGNAVANGELATTTTTLEAERDRDELVFSPTAATPEFRPRNTEPTDLVTIVIFRRTDLACLSETKLLRWNDSTIAVPKAPCDD